MDKIVWYNHTFSSINIKPAFYDVEVIGGTLYYAYYFMLYPTGLAIVLAVPNELASISYNPTTNYFTTADSLSSGMVKLASITPKIYQFVGASQILVSAGAWSNTRSNTNNNAHYKWYFTTPNPISLNTSTKRIVWQGTEYGSLPEILFIDPALWMWQTLSTNSVDTIRYPLYKKNNLYYKSTTTLDTNAQYLSVAGDAFSHSGELSSLSQSWTKGYASRNKLGILLNTTTPNPQIPSSNSTFSQATITNNTKDVYQTDNSRFMTEKFGIKDGNTGYQLSIAPSLPLSGGYFLGREPESKITYPTTQCSRNNPWILFRNDKDYYQGVQITQNDIFFIDQFVLQVKNNQFKIPLNWTVRYYTRRSNPNYTFYGGILASTSFTYAGRYERFKIYSQPSFYLAVGLGSGQLYYIYSDTVQTGPTPWPGKSTFEFTQPDIAEYKLNQQNWESISTDSWYKELIFTITKLNLKFSIKNEARNASHMRSTYAAWDSDAQGYGFGDTIPVPLEIAIKINSPHIPGVEPSETTILDIHDTDDFSFNKEYPNWKYYWNDSNSITGNWHLKHYFDNNPNTGILGTGKFLLEINYILNGQPGLIPLLDQSLVINNNPTSWEYYTDSSYSAKGVYVSDVVKENQGNIAAFSAHMKSTLQNYMDVVVAYPEE